MHCIELQIVLTSVPFFSVIVFVFCIGNLPIAMYFTVLQLMLFCNYLYYFCHCFCIDALMLCYFFVLFNFIALQILPLVIFFVFVFCIEALSIFYCIAFHCKFCYFDTSTIFSVIVFVFCIDALPIFLAYKLDSDQ